MYDFKRYTFPEEKKKNNLIYGFFSLLFILIIIIFTLLSGNSLKSSNSIAVSNLTRVENKFIIDNVKMEDDIPQAESEGEIIFDDSFDDDLRNDKVDNLEFDTPKDKKKSEKRYSLDKLKKKDKRWHHTKYKIKQNDTIWQIAKKFNTDFRLIIIANNIDKPDTLKPGTLIVVPNRNGLYYDVMKGDTLTSIARRYRISINNILLNNTIGNKNFLRVGDTIFLPDAVDAERIYKKKVIANNKIQNKKSTSNDRNNLALLWPVTGRISSGFGYRKNPLAKGRQFHCGIDISCDVGTPVKAAYDGEVIYSGWKGGYGNLVIIRHPKGFITVYGHNSENLVKEGNKVTKGQVIAKSGMTGAVTGAHLHFELRKYLTPLNPLRFLKEK